MIEAKNVEAPDEKYTFEHGDVHIVNLTGMTVGRATFRPGFRWSTDVKPVVGTDSCQLAHTSYVVSGRFHVRMDDGTERELGPGDAHVVSPGHDAWVVGDEPCVAIDFSSTGNLIGGQAVRCPCGVEFRVADDHQLGHLVAAVQEHARTAHGHELTGEEVLAEIGSGFEGARVPPDGGGEAAVCGVIEAYGDRLRASDVVGVVDLYTTDATVMAPDLPAAHGTDEVTATYSAALDACAMDYRFAFDAVDIRGDIAVARTRATGATTVRTTGESSPGEYRELFVLHRTSNGWRIAEYMFQPRPGEA